MKTDKSFHNFIMQILTPLGVTSRAMFGGFGLYKGKVIFGAIIENHLYFRVDETNKSDYEAYQSQPFIFEGQKKPVRMPYMTLPDEIFENQVLLKVWIQKALEASLRHKLKKANKKKMIK